MYGQNPGLSPHYQIIDPLVQTPSPSDVQYNLPYRDSSTQMNNQTLPPINILYPNWNMASTSQQITVQQNISEMNIDSVGGLSSLLDLDSHQLRQIDLNSGDLTNITACMFDTNNLSENLSNSLSLIDIPRNDQNMTDSLTRLANKTLDNMFP